MDNVSNIIERVTPPLDEEAKIILTNAYEFAVGNRNEFLTPEHILLSFLNNDKFITALRECGVRPTELKNKLVSYIDSLDSVPEFMEPEPDLSFQANELMDLASLQAINSMTAQTTSVQILNSFFHLRQSNATYFLDSLIKGEQADLLAAYMSDFDIEELPIDDDSERFIPYSQNEDWKDLVVCINDIYKRKNPLIGRESELESTIRILCRKEKNNPLHIGDPGVGKTALIYGLASLIENGNVPEKLKGAKIYRMDMGDLLAGTQFRGDFEKKIKLIMDGASKEKNVIIYIDEIHNIVGAGQSSDGSMDASNMLKPYLESGEIRFIGATTYDEYKRFLSKSKSILRRFSNIDVLEPSVEETVNILHQLKESYENFHGVKYSDEALEWAAKWSSKYINDRFLPDKAIDLLDEAGASIQSASSDSQKIVNKELISKILAKTSKIDSLEIKEEKNENLENLYSRISSKIYGQDKAVSEVTEAIQISKAGLTDDAKTIANFLFVGPTGVGKTEVAKVLAEELGINLIRFDMSEYVEKHAVAKLIGSPAGYVGYEDGGLLTDAIRKTPHSVLLLDEIEKAHQDIYNILLQIMDYASLTDNKGNKADFRNVILIMTSNAGAQFAKQASLGFERKVSSGESMLAQVKKTFKPEFINRLSSTVVFNDMNREMAKLILEKKLTILKNMLCAKKVSLDLSEDALEYLMKKGFSEEYGGREIERVINSLLKPSLMKEILFGELKNGGKARFSIEDGKLCLNGIQGKND